MTVLLDGNMLIALGDADHIHHDAARRWFAALGETHFATCPITQGTLLRHLLRRKIVPDAMEAVAILRGFAAHPSHRFWPDDLACDAINWRGVLGHRQVTDAYLAGLARKRRGRLATLDSGLAALHDDIAERVPT